MTGNAREMKEVMTMKTAHRKTGRGGFTLIELLVVIAIIGILAAILLPAINRAIVRAEIARARSEMAQIVTAIKSYFGEYGVMPTPNTNGYQDHTFSGIWGTFNGNPKPNSVIMDILRAVDRTNNLKGIVFLDVPVESMKGDSTLPTHQDTYNGSEGFYLDPWGNPYVIVMDTDFDGQIGGFNSFLEIPAIATYIWNNSPRGNGTYPGVTVGVMSYGPDPGETESFLTSW